MHCTVRQAFLFCLRAFVQAGHDKFSVTQHFSRGIATIAGAEQHFKQLVASGVKVHFTAQDARNVHVDVFAHGADGAGVGRQLDHRQDGVADDVALTSGEEVGHKAGGGRKA